MFRRRMPSERRVDSCIKKQDWKSNTPTAKSILPFWKPSGSVGDAMNEGRICKLIENQKWKGLLVTDVGKKGKGVIATRIFQAGEVVCDYHGKVVRGKEGQETQSNTVDEETGYMFFFSDGHGKRMCIDAHSPFCECHPGRITFGRLINHSSKKDNLRPRRYSVDVGGHQKQVILLLSTTVIKVDEELLFNYGGRAIHRVCKKGISKKEVAELVKQPKKDALEVLEFGRIWEYGLICKIILDADPVSRMIEELKRRKMWVNNIPPQLPSDSITHPDATVSVTSDGNPSDAPVPVTSDGETSDSVSSGETFQCERDVEWKDKPRKLMAEMGLYKKHSLDHHLLKSFANHLDKDLTNKHWKQEVENVSRFMYYIDAQEPSLQFVMERVKTQEYIRLLTVAGLSPLTITNYLKSVKRFLKYHTVNTELRKNNAVLHADCKFFMEFIGSLQTVTSKKVSKVITQQRHERLIEENPLTPYECGAILRVAFKDFLSVIGKADSGELLSDTELCLINYYLGAVIILGHLQPPGVVKGMTVYEWKHRTSNVEGYAVVGVKDHKTAVQQVASFALNPEQEHWFHVYYKSVRTQLVNSKKRKRVEKEDTHEEERFFISTTCQPIHNPSTDLNVLHDKYNIPKINSQKARRAFETAAATLAEKDSSMVAGYLAHSTDMAKKHYRMKRPDHVVIACELLNQLSKGVCLGDEGTSTSSAAARKDRQQPSRNIQIDADAAMAELCVKYPVTVDGTTPDLAARSEWSPSLARTLYGRWSKKQMTMRIEHILSMFRRLMPSERRVDSCIKKQDWKSNTPTAKSILPFWKPSGSVGDAMNEGRICKLIENQKWKGLLVTDVGKKGKGVIATRIFQAGEVVCDYHGKVVRGKEGQETQSNTVDEETGYMFFFSDGHGKRMCIDAHSPFCECHPGRTTFGRLINHSSKKDNLRPRRYSVDVGGHQKQVILLLSTTVIKVDEELLFNYGVNKKSHRGEGLDLDWL
ncbi:hypothetical protein NQZ68_040492 [Dissostichus eleginoides]|nr:hypothetical protein NQZ68_040492 [Dissostichus eleginoides]